MPPDLITSRLTSFHLSGMRCEVTQFPWLRTIRMNYVVRFTLLVIAMANYVASQHTRPLSTDEMRSSVSK